MKITLKNIKKLDIKPKKWDRIYLLWDLWAGKTTFSKYIINDILWVKEEVTSPTYTYYNKYSVVLNWEKINIFHFDLYRLKDYDEFFNIAWEDIFDDEDNIILVEWPDIIEKFYKPNIKLKILKTQNNNEREVEIEKFNN
jgi:tRNA threonylcarbamoyladenosine biosynthesis protein TsaE